MQLAQDARPGLAQLLRITPQPSDNPRNTALDLLRVVMALLIVCGHGHMLIDVNETLFFYVFADGFVRVVVPVFMLITGYYFSVQVERGIWSWVKRLTVLYLVWTAIYAPFLILGPGFSIQKGLFYLFTGVAHLWYVPAIIFGGLILWRIRDWPTRRLVALAATLYSIGWAVQFAMNATIDYETVAHRSALFAVPRNFLFFGLPFLALGHVMARPGVLQWVQARLTPTVFAAIVVIGFAEITMNYTLFDYWDTFELNLVNLALAPMLVAWALQVRLSWQASWLAPLSAAIYFVHPMVLQLLELVLPPMPTINSLIAVVLCLGAGWVVLKITRLMRLA